MDAAAPCRVLLVDDEDSLLLTIGANLELAGVDVATASSGEQAIALFKAQPFDLVLSDIRMPGMNGVDLFRNLRSLRPGTPVILMTAFAVEDLVASAISEGAFTVLSKPFDVDQVLPILLRASRRPVVLIVDDERALAEWAAQALTEAGVRARALCDGEEAIAAVRSGEIDVCVVDLVMPGRSGVEVVESILAIDPSIICIAMTGHDMPELIRSTADKGAFACMRKPITASELTHMIARARARTRAAPQAGKR
jgi:DNA-binding NtrC family response regulator